MHARRLTAIAALFAIGAVISCTDSSPVAPRLGSALSGKRVKPDAKKNESEKVKVIRWSGSGLKHDVSASAIIGADGGVITLPDLGVTFTVPAGALDGPTTITITAVAGHHVVFLGAPEGTLFQRPAMLHVDLTHTNASHDKDLLNELLGGYIPTVSSINPDDSADDTEDYAALTDDSMTTALFPVPHFSVVILASQIRCSTCEHPGKSPE